MRKLNQKETDILAKLTPEMMPLVHYRSILPPVSMHFAADEEDFLYLTTRILDGSECLLCIYPEFARFFVEMLEEKVPGEAAKRLRELCRSSTEYEA